MNVPKRSSMIKSKYQRRPYYGKQKEKRLQTKTNDRRKEKPHPGTTAGIRNRIRTRHTGCPQRFTVRHHTGNAGI